MPVEQTVLLKTKTTEGVDVVIHKEEPVVVDTTVTVVCDGPNCAGDGNGPTTITWNDNDVATGTVPLPDAVHQIVTLVLSDGRKFALCGYGCVTDWLKKNPPLRAVPQVVNIEKFKESAAK